MKESIEHIKAYTVSQGEITNVEWIQAVKLPEPLPFNASMHNPGGYYRVTLLLKPSPQSHITVVVCLPEKNIWNGKFLGTGNGGYAGVISELPMLNGVSRGYAAANTDMGTSLDPDDFIGIEEVWIDYGHRATHLMTEEGKKLTEWFYGQKPAHSYFLGGSTGGQQALSEAQRYPEDYDGIVCLSPAFDRIRLHAFFIWNWQRIHTESDGRFTLEQATKWREAVVKVYGTACGSNEDDAFLVYPGGITQNPMDNPELTKAAEALLTQGQRRALRDIYDGPKNPVTGEAIIAPFLAGTENESLSLADMSDRDTFSHNFFYPFRWIFDKDFDFMAFDFDKDLENAIQRLSRIVDADDSDLSEYEKTGGKLLAIGGSSDAIIPYTGFLDYYRKVIKTQGSLDKTKQFFRFFLMPGLSHTVGGNGVQDIGVLGITEVPRTPEHDALCAMENWVERGIAPTRLLGTHFKSIKSGLSFDHVRPAYAYPYIAKFTGGDAKNPDNYIPVANEALYKPNTK